MFSQIRWRRDQHPMRRCEPARDHTLRQIEATTDGRVEALANQIDLTIIEVPVWRDRRKAPQEFTQQGHDIEATKDCAHADFERARRLSLDAGQISDGILNGIEACADLTEEALTGFRESQATRTPLEQPDTESGFQLGDTLAHRCWRQTQTARSFGETADLRTANETLDTAEAFHVATLNFWFIQTSATTRYSGCNQPLILATNDLPTEPLENSMTPQANLTHKVALIQGGSRGIGAAIVKRLAEQGAAVAFTYVSSHAKARELQDSITAKGGKALAIQADSADAEAIRRAVKTTVDTFGQLDILVNNAGVLTIAPLEDFSLEDFDKTLTINVRSVFIASQEAARHMTEGGRIINIGSTNADRMPFGGGGPYAMSKAALVGLTKGLSRDLGPRGITINNVQPGPVDTDMNPAEGDFADSLIPLIAVGRYGKAEEIASFVAYLAGPEAGYITGASLTIDGGFGA